MLFSPEKYKIHIPDVNEELALLKGELDDRMAQITLAKFLRRNLHVTCELFCNFQLAHHQNLALKAFFRRNFSLLVWARGASKTTVAALFCFLYCIFEPGAKIIISGPSFRTARHMFNELEKFVNNPKSVILRQAFGVASKRSDLFYWSMTHPDGRISEISAIPLSGEKVRGFRANVLIIDEFLTMQKDIVEAILVPFLSVPLDIGKRHRIRLVEDNLIKSGRMTEDQRMSFDNNTKVILLSSASYTFQYLYEKYNEFIAEIKSDKEVTNKYFVCQLGYEAIPKYMLSQEIIEAQKNGGSSEANFKREFGALFVDDNEGFYSARKMNLVTLPIGEEPTLQIVGDKGKKYVLAIDPSFSNSENSDFFAMAVMELDEENETSTLVHNYAVAGGDLKDHIAYFFYLINNFNIELVIIDNAGFQFLDSATESERFKTAGISIEFFDFDSDLLGIEYETMVRNARFQFSKAKVGGRIAFKQNFTSEFIRNANVLLQTAIDHQKVWFGSKIKPSGRAFDKQSNFYVNGDLIKRSIPDLPKGTSGLALINELIEHQDTLVDDVKKQCALIEVKITAKGTQSFDLPIHLKREEGKDRPRKDNYTALLLGVWGTKCYFDIRRAPAVRATGMFVPVVVK